MKENLKIGLLGVIALVLVLDTFVMDDGGSSSSRRSARPEPTSSAAASSNGITPDISGTNTFDASPTTPAQPAAPTEPPTTMSFGESSYDFGNIKQNTENKHIFSFTNTGDNPLIIQNAKGSCGCTVPKYPKEPIPPGGTGEIEVVYSPGKQKGKQSKTVTITANTDPVNTQLSISAEVEEVPDESGANPS